MGEGWIPMDVRTRVDDIPDDILQACFARLPLRCHGRLRGVCKRWLRLSDPECLYLLRKSMGLTQPCAYTLTSKYQQGLYSGLQITFAEISKVPSKVNYSNSTNNLIDACHLTNLRSVALLQGPPRLQFCATSHGRLLYILGGRSPLISRRPDTWVVFNRVDVYDTVTNTWMQATPMNEARYAFAVGAFTREEDRHACLVVAGGYDAHGLALASVELYDATSDEWRSLPCMSSLSGACKGEFTHGKFYVKMANNGPLAIEAFDPSLLCWTSPFSSSHKNGPYLESECMELLAFDNNLGAIFFEL